MHWLTHKDGPARALHVDPGARARLPRVLGETGKVAWVTDAAGPDALEIASVTGETGTVRLAEGAIGSVVNLAAAPDGTTVAAAAHDGRLLVVDVESGQVTELAASDDGAVTGLSWSPDSAWLAWSQPGTRAAAADPHGPDRRPLEVVEVTDGRFADTDPVFTADGLYLAFLSVRSFDPVYDAQSFDLSFPFGSRPYLVPLAAHTPSPFGPLPEGRPVGAEPAAENGEGTEPAQVRRRRPAGPRGAGPGDRGPLLRPAGGQGRPGLAPRPGHRRARRRRRRPGRRRAAPGPGTLRPAQAGGHRDRPRDRLVRRQRRRHPAGRARPRRAAGHAVLRQARRRGRDRHGEQVPGPVPGRPGRAVAARVRRGGADHAPGLLGPGHVRGGLGRRAGVLPAAAGPDPRLGRLRRPALGGAGRDRHVALLRAAGPRRGAEASAGRPAGRGPVARRLGPLDRGPGAARRVVRPAGPLAAGRPRGGGAAGRRGGGGGRAAGRPGARAVAAAGRHRGPAGRADRPDDPTPAPGDPPAGPPERAGSSWCRCATSGGCATRTGWPGGAPWSASSARGASATCTSRT